MHVQRNPLFRLISARDDNGRTALHWACSGGHKEIVQWLVENGSEIDARDDSRWTPLIIAASAGHEAIVRLLIGRGANINACTDQGRSALLYASSRNRLPIVKLLVNEGADVNLQACKFSRKILTGKVAPVNESYQFQRAFALRFTG